MSDEIEHRIPIALLETILRGGDVPERYRLPEYMDIVRIDYRAPLFTVVLWLRPKPTLIKDRP